MVENARNGEERPRIAVANRADGSILYWVGKLYLFAGCVIVAALLLTCVLTYRAVASMTPKTPDLSRYASVAPGITHIYAADGTPMAEFATEWRQIVAFDDIPKDLVNAFLAVEDHEFYDHSGIYPRGIMRAAWANITAGDFEQGGSTITQQVAKQFLGNEKSLTRKAKEAVMARRLEARYSKEAILSVYLNHIFLGNGAYGVQSAAQRYFSKDLDELTLAEMATIAGLAQAPSRYSPTSSPERALGRRDQVLDKMVEHGFATEEQVAAAKLEPLVLNLRDDLFPDVMPHFAEHVRRYVIEHYGEKALMEDGLTVETTVLPTVQAAAVENVDFGARKQDKRQGWRGPVWHVEGTARDTFLERSAELYGAGPLEPKRRYLGVVDEVDSRGAVVIVGETAYDMPLDNMRWAAPWSATDATNDHETTNATRVVRAGDVVWVTADDHGATGRYQNWRLDGLNPHWIPAREPRPPKRREGDRDRVALDQVPHPQSAILTADHETGYVLAMVGGYDFSRSEYNRAVQACRQPGSTYKPIYYSAALDMGYGFETQLNDRPVVEVDPITGEEWIPTNLGGTVDDKVTLEYALVFSKNIPSVAIFKKVGADKVEKWARRLGFTTEIIADKALALGASCTRLDELMRAFAIFARNGRWIDWSYVRRIVDRDGNVLEDNTVFQDPWLTPSGRLDRLAATAGDRAKQAIPARAAFLTSKLLAQEVRHGFAWITRQTGIESAGKTGTSSATMDTSFVGYTSKWITAVWLGDDRRIRPLGKSDAAYITVVPMWTRYMYEVTQGHANEVIPWEVPEGVDPDDRGDHSLGARMGRMNLVYRKTHLSPPEEGEDVDGEPTEGTGGDG